MTCSRQWLSKNYQESLSVYWTICVIYFIFCSSPSPIGSHLDVDCRFDITNVIVFINRSRITVGLVIKSNFILRSIRLPKIRAACIFLVLSSVFVVLKPLFYWFKTTWHFPTLLVISRKYSLMFLFHCCIVQPISYLWALCYTLPKYALTWGLYR